MGVRFTNYDVEKDREAYERKKRLDSSGVVPVAFINGHKIIGCNENDYVDILGAGY